MYKRSEDIFLESMEGNNCEEIKVALKHLDELGFDWFLNEIQALVDKQNAVALFYASQYPLNGESDIEFDKRHLKQLKASAEQNYIPAVHELAIHYDNGGLVVQDVQHAALLFKRAAEAGHPHAQWIYSLDLLYGRNGIEKNKSLGITYLKKSAEAMFEGALETLSQFHEEGKFGFAIDRKTSNHYRAKMSEDNVIGY